MTLIRQLLLTVLLCGISVSQSWTSLPSGTSEDLYDVHFVNASVGTAVGANAKIVRTTDGGATWTSQTSPVNAGFLGVHFVDANTGWIVGGGGNIIHTTDGGATWVLQTSGFSGSLDEVFFTDANTGYAAGRYGNMLRTTNGGSTWNAEVFSNFDWFSGVSFFDADHGFATGLYGRVLKIENGVTSVARASFSNPNMYSVAVVGTGTAFICGDGGRIETTTDGGTTWNTLPGGTTNALLEISFTDPLNGLVVGVNGTIRATTNGGSSWNVHTSGTTATLRGVHCVNGGLAFVVGNGGTILRSADVGLPVELTSFTGVMKGKSVELQWNTSTETDNLGFEVERRELSYRINGALHQSADESMHQWSSIGFIIGHGTTNAPQSYSYIDAKASGRVEYRLKQLDRDGSFSYSPSVEMDLGAPAVFELTQNNPNPFNPSTLLAFTVPAADRVTLTVYNGLGQAVAILFDGMAESGVTYERTFDASSLASGVYIARLHGGQGTRSRKMMLMK